LATRQPCLARVVPKTSVDIADERDVIAFLTTQHQQIKKLSTDVTAARGDKRREAFAALRRLPAVHKAAEEETVHPRARREISAGDTVVDTASRKQAKKQLAELESLDVDSAEFETNFQALHTDVLQHADTEEQREFSQLAAELEPDQLNRMRRAVRLAEARLARMPASNRQRRI
jgi:hemerythrin superfamily protein